MHGLVREFFKHGWVNKEYVAAHTVGVAQVRSTVQPRTPEAVAETCGVAADEVRAAACVVGVWD